MRKVYIQKQGNRIFSESCYSAALGFAHKGYHVVECEADANLYVALCNEPESMFVGGIKTMQKAFRAIAITPPQIDNPHIHLPQYLGREVFEATWHDVELMVDANQVPFFIKPLDEQKLFTGYVINKLEDLSVAKYNVKSDTKILISECVDFISEYRCFVLNKEMVGCKNYKGDFKIFPDFKVMENAIKDYKEQPIAYSIDFGVTSDGRTLLIEMNDAYGLGSYGLDKNIYCRLLEARWDEIIKNSINVGH